jgi:hypothetical protein
MRRSLVPVWPLFLLACATAIAQPVPASTAPEAPQAVAAEAPARPALTVEQQREFLANAKIVAWKDTKKGVTRPLRVTLSDGTFTHDASFQRVDIRKARAETAKGVEVNFRDYYGFNIAAHQLACLINRCDLVPATVERTWRGEMGALCWWVDEVMMDEGERIKSKQGPPSSADWWRQQHLSRVFTELTGDTDRNQTNILITKDWRLVLIDFSRAFRAHKEPKPAINTVLTIEADVLEGLRALTKERIAAVAGRWLEAGQIEAVLARRDAIVAHIDRLIAAKGRELVVLEPSRPVSAQ